MAEPQLEAAAAKLEQMDARVKESEREARERRAAGEVGAAGEAIAGRRGGCTYGYSEVLVGRRITHVSLTLIAAAPEL